MNKKFNKLNKKFNKPNKRYKKQIYRARVKIKLNVDEKNGCKRTRDRVRKLYCRSVTNHHV